MGLHGGSRVGSEGPVSQIPTVVNLCGWVLSSGVPYPALISWPADPRMGESVRHGTMLVGRGYSREHVWMEQHGYCRGEVRLRMAEQGMDGRV